MAGCSSCGGRIASLQARLASSATPRGVSPNAYGRVQAPTGSVRKPLMQRIEETDAKEDKEK